MNPMDLIKNYMTKGMTLQGIVKSMAGNNPIFNNLISMMEKGDEKGVETFAKNMLKERGLMISSVESIEEYLDEHYDRYCMDYMTVGEFAERFPYGTYLVTMPRSYRGYQRAETSLTHLTVQIE